MNKKNIYHREHGENILIFKQNKDHRVITQKVNRGVSVSSCYSISSLCTLWLPFIG